MHPPLFQQKLRVFLNESNGDNDVSVAHAGHAPDTRGMASSWQLNEHDTPCAIHVNMRRPMLSWWEQDAHSERSVPQYGGHAMNA